MIILYFIGLFLLKKKRLNSVHAKVSSFTLEFLKINLLLLRPWKYLKSKTNTNVANRIFSLPRNYPNKWTVPLRLKGYLHERDIVQGYIKSHLWSQMRSGLKVHLGTSKYVCDIVNYLASNLIKYYSPPSPI